MNARKRILVVDDEEDILELVEYNLAKNGYDVTCVTSGEEALECARRNGPDLILLDLMLPGVDGLEVCRRLRNDGDPLDVPIVMLTARGEEADIVAGLELGADDYVTKPFSTRVLVARVNAVLRRQDEDAPTGDSIRIHEILIHPGRHEATVNNQRLDLTYTEFCILKFLAQRPGWVYTRDQIIDAVRGSDYPVTERSVDVQIVGLRKKMGDCGRYIETVRGVGYRLKE
ncbi:MAG: response regulator [bacterium]|nr:response regulator [bacterium]